MIFDVSTLVATLSEAFALAPGDVIEPNAAGDERRENSSLMNEER